jgi:hypothetical protein
MSNEIIHAANALIEAINDSGRTIMTKEGVGHVNVWIFGNVVQVEKAGCGEIDFSIEGNLILKESREVEE